MDKSKFGGGLISLASVVVAALFVWGIIAQYYWAIAIPVLIGFLGVLALTFWIGWTIAVTEAEPPSPPAVEEPPTSPST